MPERFSSAPALAPLKAFQKATVDYVSGRLLTDPEPDRARHFLVADEVGLGKTMVARGVIARTIEELQDSVKRIDIVYICSNGAIAKQNVARLNVLGKEQAKILPTRLSMLPLQLAEAGGINDEGVNFFSLTPATSLDLKRGGGMKAERALILRLIWDLLEDGRAVARMFQVNASRKGWEQTRVWVNKAPVVSKIAERYYEAVRSQPGLLREIEDCARAYKGLRKRDSNLNQKRDALIWRLRTMLAKESADALEPDLIVLDEFQRFHELLHGNDEAAELARMLFEFEDREGNKAKTLLLSATPYRMLSLRGDDEGAGDHYKEFLDVLEFLFGRKKGLEVRAELENEMRRFRSALQGLPARYDDAHDIKNCIENNLRRVISRTERVSETENRDAMMKDVHVDVTVQPEDLRDAQAIANVAQAAKAPGTVEYWKSAPYLLSFLRDYKLAERLEAQSETPSQELLDAMKAAERCQLDITAIENFERISPNNGRMRALMQCAYQEDMGRRLWVPPSLPYFGNRVKASKMLIFSKWGMVPDAIAALLSYESERQMGVGEISKSYSERTSARPLQFRMAQGRLAGLRAIPLVLPSPNLALLADPLQIFRERGHVSGIGEMRHLARERLAQLAETLTAKTVAGEREATWDWAGGASVDMQNPIFKRWVTQNAKLRSASEEENWPDHIAALTNAAKAENLHGRAGLNNILSHLTDLALGSPAICALRALSRVAPDLPLDDPLMLNAATRIAMGFRTLFNQPETQALLRHENEGFYWRAVLRYCADNDLQSVLDEYAHVLLEAEGLATQASKDAVPALADAMIEALSLKPAQIDVKNYSISGGKIHQSRRLTMRGRFATRLAQQGREETGTQRTDAVRQAFNSPFRPFVLASTSVGQEGLDFHPYCHRLVHWNLPSNPVDLEQREGRVHRYKNHAVRLNLAEKFQSSLTDNASAQDPWAVMFAVAHANANRPGDLEPFWLLEGTTSVDRYVLSLPFSKEKSLMGRLKRSVALYRLAFGQPRQDDLLAFLETAEESLTAQDLANLQINLRPAWKFACNERSEAA